MTRDPARARRIAMAVALVAAGCTEDVDGNGSFGGETGSAPPAVDADTSGGRPGSSDGTVDPPADSEDGGGGPKLDVASDDPAPGGPCDDDLDSLEFSHIWIANSWEGTVSKIDTFTGVELGRYRTGPDADPDPSRTSVNLAGDVAVVNRSGGITKIEARSEACPDRDGDGVVRTSSGADDVLPWGADDCVAWHVALPSDPGDHQGGPRPVAWEGGKVVSGDDCAPIDDPRVWVGWYDTPSGAGIVRRLDGQTGATLDEVVVPEWGSLVSRPYGGAVDGDGHFWVVGQGSAAPAVRIDANDLSVVRVDNPPGGTGYYGMAVDAEGAPWISGCSTGSLYRLDPQSLALETVAQTEGCLRGMAIDRDGIAWVAANGPCRLVKVDTITKSILDDAIEIPGCQMVVGVSIDVEGHVWVVDYLGSAAYKIDPDTHAVLLTNDGLHDPYTYSDMTGAGLDLVVNPPAG